MIISFASKCSRTNFFSCSSRPTPSPAYLHTVSMNELYQNIYQSRPPIIDGLLYPGTYLQLRVQMFPDEFL